MILERREVAVLRRSRSLRRIFYSRSQLEASAANKDSFFAKMMAENESKPEGLGR